MGNLGRAGYGATLDGMVSPPVLSIFQLGEPPFLLSLVAIHIRFVRRWYGVGELLAPSFLPLTKDKLFQNQTYNGVPQAALEGGDPSYNDVLSYLPGQRLSRCTCEGESHPGPVHSDGTYVGRAAPEIDVFEAQVDSNLVVWHTVIDPFPRSGYGQLKGEVSQSSQWAVSQRQMKLPPSIADGTST
jgi:hypothetical protein